RQQMPDFDPYAPPTAPTDPAFSSLPDPKLLRIVVAQKQLLLGVLLSVVALIAAFAGTLHVGQSAVQALTAAYWVLYGVRAVLAYRLAAALDTVPFLWAIGAFIPSLIGL